VLIKAWNPKQIDTFKIL